ncbi:MAG: DUF6079 family protein [bacterium]
MIKDLITLPEIRTVVQLSDITDPALQEELASGFILTEDVFTNLTILLDQFITPNGVGIFLEGSFGSGKSHFLSIISLLLSKPEIWEHFLKQRKDLADYYLKIKNKRLLPINISLISHANRESLEEIIYDYLNQDSSFFNPKASRRENFARVPTFLQEQRVDGIVILIDELSEFLRSKAESRTFNEDIRFLQFLGEYSLKNPVWVVASLQERLEDLGAINEDSFNKIKDRYKIRLFLTAEHIGELIKKKLIVKKPEALDQLNTLYNSFKRAFPQLKISQDNFVDLYPVHPSTLLILDELKFLFSQKRGIIDFIHYQIKGDNSRKIRGMLEMPIESLLGPEYIFDHFLVRIRETTTTRIYYQTVYEYYLRELETLFPDPELKTLAQRLINILILKAFSPYKKGLTIRELGEMTLCKITSLDSSVNYRYLADILERLHKEGSYIGYQKGEDFYNDLYYIDLKEDIQGVIRQKAEYIRQGLLPDDERIFDCLGNWIEDTALPLATLKRTDRIKEFTKWQFTGREGFVYLRSLNEISVDELKELMIQYRHSEDDFFLFIDRLSNKNRDIFYKRTLMALKELGEPLPFIFWLPKYPDNDKGLRDGLVYYLLFEKYKTDHTETGRRIFEYLSSLFEDRKARVRDIFKEAYFNGELLYLSEEGIKKVNEIGILSFTKLISRITFFSLNRLYPHHKDISPLADYFVRDTLLKVIERFFRSGEIIFEPGMDKGIELMIEGYLKPVKLIKQIGRGYRLSVDPAISKIASLYLNEIKKGRVKLDDLYFNLRKGEYGLSKNQFEMLTLAMLFSGHAKGISNGREVSVNRPDFSSIWIIEEIGEGEMIDPGLREVVPNCFFIPQRLRKEGFSFSNQQKIWESLIELKRKWGAEEDLALQMLRQVSGYRSLAHLDLKRIEEDFFKIKILFNELKVSYSAKEGLERFLFAYKTTAFIDQTYERVERFKEFMNKELDAYTNIFSYLHDPALVIPNKEEYSHLVSLKAEAEELLLETEKIFSRDYLNDLGGRFNRFKEAYVLIYQKEHNKLKSVERLGPYIRLKESQRYNLLARISRLDLISVENDLVKVNRYLAEIESTGCKALDPEQLRKRPVCNCGFKFGELVELTPIRQIEETIDKGIIEYITGLKEPRYKEQVASYAVSLDDIGKKREAEGLRDILGFSLNNDDQDINRLEMLINDKLINGLNEAFIGKVVILERDINELLENIIDRNFPREKLLSIFNDWLNQGRELNKDVYIKIRYKTTTKQDQDNHLVHIVRQAFPEFIPLLKDLGEESFQHLLITSVWGIQHSVTLDNTLTLTLSRKERETSSPPLIFDNEELRTKDEERLNKFQRVFEYALNSNQERFLRDLEDTERFLISKGIDDKLLELIIKDIDGEEELLQEVFKEGIFIFPIKKIVSLLLKRLDSERDPRSIKKVNKLVQQWVDQRTTENYLTKRLSIERYARLLHDFTRILQSLLWLDEGEGVNGLNSTKLWEKTFLEHGAELQIIVESIIKEIQELGLTESISLKRLEKEKESFLTTFDQGFKDYISKEYKTLISTRQREVANPPLFINSVRFNIYKRYNQRLNPSQTHFLLIDGMRWDMWGHCQEGILRLIKDRYRLVEQLPLWVFLPSVTATQLEPLISGDIPLGCGEKDLEIASAEEERQQTGYTDKRCQELGQFTEIIPEKDSVFMVKYSLIDNKIHSSKDDLLTFYNEASLTLQSALNLYLARIPTRSMVIIFADHGFVERKVSRKEVKTSRYTHGGASPWEMIVPLVVLYRWR